MKRCVACAAILLLVSMLPAFAAVRIHNDPGGQIGRYLAKYRALRVSGEKVIIDGTCSSACTMLLGAIDRSRICVTPRAMFEFHSAWTPTPSGPEESAAGNFYLWSNYPADVRDWINRHGGLRLQSIYLRGHDLAAMYPTCP
jgi:hypothetical protein